MRIVCVLLLLLLGSQPSLALEAARGAPTLLPLAIDSVVLGEPRQLMIYLPAGYQDSQHRYRAAGFGQWLQFLNRLQDALTLLQWNRQTYPKSLDAHQALIKAYVHFKLMQEAKTALAEALQQLTGLSEGDQAALRALL